MSLDGLSNRKNIFETGSKYYSTQSSLNYLINIKNNPINTTIKKEEPRQKIIIILILNKSFLYDLSTKFIRRISGLPKESNADKKSYNIIP